MSRIFNVQEAGEPLAGPGGEGREEAATVPALHPRLLRLPRPRHHHHRRPTAVGG